MTEPKRVHTNNAGQSEIDDLPSWVPDPRPWKAWSGRQPWHPQNFQTATWLGKTNVLLWKGCLHRLTLRGAVFDSILQTFPLRNAIQKQPLRQEGEARQLLGFDEAFYYIASVWFHAERRLREMGGYATGEHQQVILRSIFTAGGTLYQLSSLAKRWSKGADWIERLWGLLQLTITRPSYEHIDQAISLGQIQQYDIPLFLSSVSLLLEEYMCVFTRNGLMGFAPKCILDGDVFAWIDGHSHPVALRPISETGTYQLVGPCYIHGLMYGELGSMNIPDSMHSLLHLV
ncbi:hypothetical protein K431DRAFT_282127 [Polychaeton citri CBS 116435]|uniref:Uncharacterized protein n=1 Tax=Polychaeton citri CBS 116435 TaxID=1314669 RepID=A0A9P4QD92_9PEZI|nr:hypothetical protein K431DRAFT_282127 [Polychaeton citri CBS 116435]